MRRIVLMALFPLRYYAYLTAPVRRPAPASMLIVEPELRRLARRVAR